MKTLEYDIVDIDYYEKDAILVVGDQRFYFQFQYQPTIGEALLFFQRDSKFYNGN